MNSAFQKYSADEIINISKSVKEVKLTAYLFGKCACCMNIHIALVHDCSYVHLKAQFQFLNYSMNVLSPYKNTPYFWAAMLCVWCCSSPAALWGKPPLSTARAIQVLANLLCSRPWYAAAVPLIEGREDIQLQTGALGELVGLRVINVLTVFVIREDAMTEVLVKGVCGGTALCDSVATHKQGANR